MKAAVWHGKEDIRIENVEDPVPGKDDVIIKVKYSGICGSDLHEYLFGPVFIPLEPHPLTNQCAPQILGHEFGGHIVDVGSEVKNLKKDDLVTVNPMITCSTCHYCEMDKHNLCDKFAFHGIIGNGGHAEFVKIKANSCFLMNGMDNPLSIAFSEPSAVCYHSVNMANVKPGMHVGILGGGAIGNLVAQFARQAGAEQITLIEPSQLRKKMCQELGFVDRIFDPLDEDLHEKVLSVTDGLGFDASIECAGSDSTEHLMSSAQMAITFTRPLGNISIVGISGNSSEFQFNDIVFTEKKIVGSFAWHSHNEYKESTQMIKDNKIVVNDLVSNIIQLDNYVKDGLHQLQHNKDNVMKILVEP